MATLRVGYITRFGEEKKKKTHPASNNYYSFFEEEVGWGTTALTQLCTQGTRQEEANKSTISSRAGKGKMSSLSPFLVHNS
jgi:hypothetical protein